MAQKILIIEDDLGLSTIFSRLLNHAGFETSQAETSTEGITRALTERPDLILTDLHLPDMIAIEAILALKSNSDTADIPVIVLTADRSAEWKTKAIKAGAVEYWIKPLSAIDLIELVSKFCRPLISEL
jgi:two-component system, sensor histidine kinase ChiS